MLAHISIPPADALSKPICMLATVGVVGFVIVLEHGVAQHVILLVVRVALFNVRDAEACPLTCISKSLFVAL